MFGILQDVIKSDVEKYNKLSGENYITQASNAMFQVRHETEKSPDDTTSSRGVTLEIERNCIVIHRLSGSTSIEKFSITSKWDEDRLKCDLYFDNKQVSMHLASQKIIGPLLFDS